MEKIAIRYPYETSIYDTENINVYVDIFKYTCTIENHTSKHSTDTCPYEGIAMLDNVDTHYFKNE